VLILEKEYLMSIDAGTGGTRTIIFDTSGNIIQKEYNEWKFIEREDIGMMVKEFNPDEFWNLITLTIKKAIKNSNIEPSKISAISTTSFRQGFILLNKEGKEIYAGPADDLRGLSIGMNLYSKYADKLYEITGRIPPIVFASARLLWFKENDPELYNQINMILMMNDWIIYKLTGEYCSEPTAACETELFDIKKRKWSDELIDLLELPTDIYPPIYNAGTQVGVVSKTASESLGLDHGTPVVVGGADSQCALLGMGLTNHGEIGIIAGTTTPIQMVLDSPYLPSKKLWTNCHLFPDKWVIEAVAGPSGKILKWFRDTLTVYEKKQELEHNKNSFKLIDELVATVPPGSNGCFSFFGPMVCDWTNLRPLGMGGFLIPLPINPEKNHAKAQILRSYFENMAYILKLNCNQIEELTNIKIEKISISGGLSNSNIFNEIVANTLNIPLSTYKISETTGLGASICASIGVGIYKSFEEAVKSMVEIKSIINPDKDIAKIYRKALKKWVKLQKSLSKLN